MVFSGLFHRLVWELDVAVVVFLCFGTEAATHAQEFPRGGAPSNPAAEGNTTILRS